MYCHLIHRSVTDLLPSKIINIISRFPPVVQWFCLHLKPWPSNNILLTLYLLLAIFFFPTQQHMILTTDLCPSTKFVSMGPPNRTLQAELGDIPSILSDDYILWEFALNALICTLHGGSVRETSTFPLSPVSISCDPISC